MHPAIAGVCVVLGVVALVNWGYAGLRISNGAPVEDNLALLTGGLVCFTLIALFAFQGGKKKD